MGVSKRLYEQRHTPPRKQPKTPTVASPVENRNALREEFRVLMRNGSYDVGRADWLAACRKLALKISKGAEPTPEQWVQAAKQVRVRCPQCNGSGRYCWGAVVNGKPTHSGDCFRCGGKGTQDQEDGKRNWAFDNHRIVGVT